MPTFYSVFRSLVHSVPKLRTSFGHGDISDHEICQAKKTKAAKVKKEKKQEEARSRSPKERKKKEKEKEPESSSSESSEESLSTEAMYKLVKPYTKIMLVNLVRKAELNGVQGQVIHPSTAVAPCPPGCMLVRLETGREIAVKLRNMQMINSWERGPHSYSQSERLKQVVKQIKHSETVTASENDSGAAILGKPSSQGGVGHVL
ncbi:unnamed protein product [Effrenium voratum]|nr:unnamed protein product [Effrenium voratum]